MRCAHEKGFTIVEVAITLLVVSVLVVGIIRLQMSVSQLSIQQVQYRIASDIAYNNLRRYVNENPPTWFVCEVVGGVAKPKTLINETAAITGLAAPVSQKVVATAPYLCGGGTSGIGMPIRVESTVTYGPDHRKVTHVSYAAF
jgi:prepilin-type cleavage/methylation N-terminal domain protein